MKLLTLPEAMLKVYIDMSCIHCQTLMHALLPRPVSTDHVGFDVVEVDPSHPRVLMSEFPHVFVVNDATGEEFKVRSKFHSDAKGAEPPEPSAPPPPYQENVDVVDMFVDIANVMKDHPESHDGSGKKIPAHLYEPVAGMARSHVATQCHS